jgi:histidinol-phosphatase
VDDDLALALSLADLADPLGLARFGARDLVVETKPDATPVTEADRAIELALRERIAAELPDDGFLGEESGRGGGRGGRLWVVDPIDGTRNFTRGVPVWATLIALERDGDMAVAVVSAPALHRRWWAARGEGAWLNGSPVHVSGVRRIEDAHIVYAHETPLGELAMRAWHTRGFGDFWAHMLVAEGAADAAVDAPGVNLWDLAAVQVVVEEAGGRFSDFAGRRRLDGGNAVTSNGRVHDEVLAALASQR